jgi:hypothetical protein
MSEITLEAGTAVREDFERFMREHPDHASTELSKGADGATMITLIVENSHVIASSLALLIATLQRRGVKVRASRDGVEVELSDAARQS